MNHKFPTLVLLIADHIALNKLPSSAFMIAMGDFGQIIGKSSYTPMVALTIYDALGETHARNNQSSTGGFSWLWDDIHGGPKVEIVQEGTYEDAINTQSWSGTEYGTMRFHLDNLTPWHKGGETDLGFLERCFKWYQATVETLGEELGRSTFFLFEPMHRITYSHGVTNADTAWPHGRGMDVLQLGVAFKGVGDDADEKEQEKMRECDKRCIEQIRKAVEITHGPRPCYPNYGDAAMGRPLSEVYGPNLPQLQEIKCRYDPHNVFISAGLRILPVPA